MSEDFKTESSRSVRCVVCGFEADGGLGYWACHADTDTTPVCRGKCWRAYSVKKVEAKAEAELLDALNRWGSTMAIARLTVERDEATALLREYGQAWLSYRQRTHEIQTRARESGDDEWRDSHDGDGWYELHKFEARLMRAGMDLAMKANER